MLDKNLKYCEYFDVDEGYFPCIDESAINSGARWDTTYPHETFIDLLKSAVAMLGGSTKRSLWIHGAYGTGKSQCAYALKKLLELPQEDVIAYWNKYERLRKEDLLLKKLLGLKEQGIVCAYRYASGSINSPQQLFYAVQESVQKALQESNMPYKGEKALRQSVIEWLEDYAHHQLVDTLLQKPKWMSTFSQSTADEIINTLKKSSDVTALMDDLFTLAAQEGVTALNLTSDNLRNWLLDVMEQNHCKIVLIWDEFSDYFRQNSNTLGEFQKIVSINQEQPFYFVIVTHPLSSIAKNYDSGDKTNPWSVVQQRFDKVEIRLPNNIAFELIRAAFSIKPAAKSQWEQMVSDLNAAVPSSRVAVAKAADIEDEKVMRDILPIHPMAALVLKNIATTFQSNQRSMFDFIKTTKDLDVHAFQWFIQNTSPLSARPFLTVDMLWDFFYDKGKEYLTPDIRMILDVFPQQKNLVEEEATVLKTVLILQAIDQRLGFEIPLLKPTDQTLSYAFEGDDPQLESTCKSLAKALCKKGVLTELSIGNGKKAYAAAVLAGDSGRLEEYKRQIREKEGSTQHLLSAGPAVADALSLTHPLRLRYAPDPTNGWLPVVSQSNFKTVMEQLKSKDTDWHFYAVLALAKTEQEAKSFRTLIQTTIQNPVYKNILVIDALSTPLGLDAFDEYVNHAAMSRYYSGNNGQQAKQAKVYTDKAKFVLERDWRNRIHDGTFFVYSHANPNGERAVGAGAVHTILQTVVLNRFPHVQDFTRGLTESQFKSTQLKQSARYGIVGGEIKGLIAGCEKLVLGKFWNRKEYWKAEDLEGEHLVIIKKSVDALIADAFKRRGKISIGEIYDHLVTTFGFSACNLSAFITGFLLREYSAEPYRYLDSEGHQETMTPDKLAEMISNYIGKNPKTTYLVSLTEEEKAFVDITEAAWRLEPGSCSSPSLAARQIDARMREFGYPVWCLEDVDTTGVYDLVKLYSKLVQSSGGEEHKVSNEIGRIARHRPASAQNLKNLLTQENCKKGMTLFLQRFEDGKLPRLANEIGAQHAMLSDVKNLFSAKRFSLWDESTGQEQIHNLIEEYEFIKNTNLLLNGSAHNLEGAYKVWRDVLKFCGFSCESIRAKRPQLDTFFALLLRIANYEDLLPEQVHTLLQAMVENLPQIRELFDSPLAIFKELYAPYLQGFTDAECDEIKNSINTDLFTATTTVSNTAVKKAADDYRKKQVKNQLIKLWRDKTQGSKNPRDWSTTYRTPILCCIPSDQYARAKSAFSVLNSSVQSEADIQAALSYLQHADFFEKLRDPDYRDACFKRRMLGEYANVIPDLEAVRDALVETGIDAYDWNDNPYARGCVKRLAQAEYDAGGSDRVVELINSMDDAQLKHWLTDVVKRDMGLGLKIIDNGRA